MSLCKSKKFTDCWEHAVFDLRRLERKNPEDSQAVMYGETKLCVLVGPRLSELEKIPIRHGLIPENLCQKR